LTDRGLQADDIAAPRQRVLLIAIDRPEEYNAADEEMHTELARIWADVSKGSSDPRRGDRPCRQGVLRGWRLGDGRTLATATSFAQQGAWIVIGDLGEAKEVADALATDAVGVGCDIASGQDVEALLAAAVTTSAPSTSWSTTPASPATRRCAR
jgi:hypothetical protein